MTWREFYDAHRNHPAWGDRVQHKMEVASGVTFKNTGKGQWTYHGDEFEAEGPRELVFAYALYRDRVLDDGGEPDAFERPTADGWA